MVRQFGCKFARNLPLYVSVLKLNNCVHKEAIIVLYYKELLELLQFLLHIVSSEKINLVRERSQNFACFECVCVGRLENG